MLPRNRFSSIALLYSLFVGVSALLRTVLLAMAWDGMDRGILLLGKIYLVGLFFDTVTFSFLALPFLAWVVLVPDRVFNHRGLRWAAYSVYLLFLYFLLIDGAAEILFFGEFGTRFNFIAVDYLIYTREVVRTIRQSLPVRWIFGGLFLASGLLLLPLRPWIVRSFRHASTFRQRAIAGLPLALVPVLSLPLVSHSAAHVSENNYANELAANGIYNFAAAFRSNELDYDRFYATRSEEEVLPRVRRLIEQKGDRFLSGDVHAITREIAGRGREERRNVIVVVEESLSSGFLGVSGNPRGLTPNLDRLAGESMYFTRLYATGTRTVRGLEAINLSMPPLPGTSVIKRPGNGNYLSWGSLMKERGYDTKFLYSGYGYFDDMNAFFSGSGFEIIDWNSFSPQETTFSNAWGVCDEDLLNRVIREADASHSRHRPFFSVVMTTSNHRPFTYPGGKIDIPSHTGRDGGVKYADYAIGKFLERARNRPWFRDTLFVIVADHCAGSAGKVALPVENYHIPLFVYAPGRIPAVRIDRLASQIDVAPTILGLLHFDYRSAFFGKDILRMEPSEERAFLSTYERLGYLTKERLEILDPTRKVESYLVRPEDGSLVPETPPENGTNDTIAYYQGASYVYKNRLNRTDSPKP